MFCLFPLPTHYKITVLKTFSLYWLKNLPTFFALHSTHQRAQHNEGTERHDARHVAKLLPPNYQNVRLCTAYLHARRFSPGASEDSVWCATETINVDELEIYFNLRKLTLGIALSNCYDRRQSTYGDILTFFFHYCLSSVQYFEGRFHTHQFHRSSHIWFSYI